jgi:hypothetical protein
VEQSAQKHQERCRSPAHVRLPTGEPALRLVRLRGAGAEMRGEPRNPCFCTLCSQSVSARSRAGGRYGSYIGPRAIFLTAECALGALAAGGCAPSQARRVHRVAEVERERGLDRANGKPCRAGGPVAPHDSDQDHPRTGDGARNRASAGADPGGGADSSPIANPPKLRLQSRFSGSAGCRRLVAARGGRPHTGPERAFEVCGGQRSEGRVRDPMENESQPKSQQSGYPSQRPTA